MKKINLFLDSGAYSAWSKGVTIDIDEYISFIKKNIKYITVYANLDVIGDPEATYRNQKYIFIRSDSLSLSIKMRRF